MREAHTCLPTRSAGGHTLSSSFVICTVTGVNQMSSHERIGRTKPNQTKPNR